MQYFVGIDIGTTSTKAIAFSREGNVLTSKQQTYPLLHPAEGRSEQDPELVFDAVMECMQSVRIALGSEPQFISFSAAMHSIIAMDSTGKHLTNSIIWSDIRAAEIAITLRKKNTATNWYQHTGVPLHAMLPFCKLIWLKENEPTIFRTTVKFIGIKEYVLFRLTAQYVVDISIAAASGFLDIHTLKWFEPALLFAGIDAGKLSQPVAITHCIDLPENNMFGIKTPCKLVVGSSDGVLANIGSDATDPAVLAITIGTSAAARIISTKRILHEEMKGFCYPIEQNRFLIGGASNNGANLIEWIKEQLFQNKNSYEEFSATAGTVAAGANGLIMLPYVSGERAPIWNEQAKAVYFGIGQQHTQAHFVRAAMEAIVYNIYSIAKSIHTDEPIQQISASGGFTKSREWLQILADVFQLTVICKPDADASARGAVLVALKALGINHEFSISEKTVIIHPNTSNVLVYQKGFQQFQKLNQLLVPEMN